MKEARENKVTIVGAGVGGLALAALLAFRGWEVHVVERASGPGGKAARRKEGSFVYDEGPSILVLKKVYEDLFLQLGEKLDDWIQFDRLNPAFKIFASKGAGFTIFENFADTLNSVAEISPVAKDELQSFVSHLDKFAAGIGLSYADRPFFSLLDFAHWPLIRSGLSVAPFEKYKQFIDKYFSVPVLREFFYGFPGYAGFHPAEAPASLALLPWSVLREGVFYPKGGVWAIVQALYEFCCKKGVRFSFNSTVSHLEVSPHGVKEFSLLENDSVTKLRPGEHFAFGGCLGWLNEAFGDKLFSKKHQQQFRKQSPSFFTIQTSLPKLQRQQMGLAHHNLLLPLRLQDSYQDYFVPGGIYPHCPPLYLNIPSVTDGGIAPKEIDNLFVVVSVPSHLQDGAGGFDRAAQQVALTNYAEQCGEWIRSYFPQFPWNQEPFHIKSSLAFEEMYLQKGGQVYGPSLQHAQQMLGLARPSLKTAQVRNFWLVGGSTQPGAGLPMVLQSAKILARHLLDS